MKRMLIVLACTAVPLAAQQPQPMGGGHGHMMGQPCTMGQPCAMMPHMQQMAQMMAPMMRAMVFTPDHLLANKDSLKLTPQQITKLTALRDAAQATHDASAADVKTHMDALAQAWGAATLDTAALRSHFQAAHDGMGKAHWVMLAAAAQARGVLTQEQRARVDQWAARMMERRTGM
jgi:Spy/CpxP family protein refolding chaperone